MTRLLLTLCCASAVAAAQVPEAPPQQDFAVRADTVYTMAGAPIADGVVLVRNGTIAAVGPAEAVVLPDGVEVQRAAVLLPGLIDAHATVGLTGYLNVPQDQDQLDAAAPVQPELRAIDAYNAHEPLVSWLRGYGITTVHTGHAPGALIAGQTLVVKTTGRSLEHDVLVPCAMLACTLGDDARAGRGGDGNKPGTRAKSAAMLREALLAAQAYVDRRAADPDAPIDLGNEMLAAVLRRHVPLLVTAHRAHDLTTALRIAREFDLEVVLDGAAEAYLLLDELRAAGCAVLPHPAMARTRGELGNGTMELARILADAGIPFALQSGFEGYVPKTRVVLFEAAVAVGRGGLDRQRALRALTIDAATLLGVQDRIGSLEVGKDADLAWYDGDPFEYTTRCTGVAIEGRVFPGEVPTLVGGDR